MREEILARYINASEGEIEQTIKEFEYFIDFDGLIDKPMLTSTYYFLKQYKTDLKILDVIGDLNYIGIVFELAKCIKLNDKNKNKLVEEYTDKDLISFEENEIQARLSNEHTDYKDTLADQLLKAYRDDDKQRIKELENIMRYSYTFHGTILENVENLPEFLEFMKY